MQDTTQNATGDGDTEKMYWCVKCGKRHRRASSIGSWHQVLERPELNESNVWSEYSKPDKSTFASAIALALELSDRDAVEVTFEQYQARYREEGFDALGDARDAIQSLRDEYSDAIFRRHSGREWVTFEATGNDSMRLKRAASEYESRGMSFGVRH